MDPLSCAASVTAVIQLAGALADVCGEYIKKVTNAQKEINYLNEEITRLMRILESLNGMLQGPDREKLAALHKISDDVGTCKVVLENLGKKVNPENTQNSFRWQGFQDWKWPLQSQEIDDAIGQLKRYTSLFVAALQIDHVGFTDPVEQNFDLHDLKIVEEAIHDSFENKNEECFPETRTELLRQVGNWAESSHGKCIYWLTGEAGTGKSTISRTVARQLKERKLFAASFYFRRNEEGRNNMKSLFLAFAQQLANAVPDLGLEIERTVKDDPYISGKAPAEQFRKLILQPLMTMDLEPVITLVAVIDALDECRSDAENDDHDIRVLLRLIPQVQESESVRLRFFMTSRPELPVRLGFKAVENSLQNMDLHSIPSSETTRDVSIFLEHSLTQIRGTHGLPADWPGEEAINDLLARTLPLFISAATMCRFISSTYDPQDRLQKVLNDKTSYVSEMARTYLPVLNQVLAGQNEWEAARLNQSFKDIVGPLIALATPLPVNALSQLLALKSSITSNHVKSLLNCLHSVLIIPDNPELPVRPRHLSFRDFLFDSTTKDNKQSEKFWIDEKAIHQKLSDQCLRVMESKLKKNICMLSDDTLQRSEIDSNSVNEHLPVELQYACRYWTQHMMQSWNPAGAVEKACSFLKKYFLHWMEVMSILGVMPEVIRAICRLQSGIQDDKDSELSKFLYDARRFVLNNRHLAETAPLQLYSSGLMFSPEGSITRRIFNYNLSGWSQLPKVEQTWSAEQQTLENHLGPVESVVFSPDGKQLVSGSYDDTVKIWDPATGELLQTLDGHSGTVESLAFSPDGKLLASGSYDNTIDLWDSATGELLQTFEGHPHSIWSVAFAPDGKELASASDDSTIKIWDLATGELQQTLDSHSQSVRSVAFSPDGKLLASSSLDSTIKVWNPATGELQQSLEGRSGWVKSVAFSPDGKKLASGSEKNTVKLWNPATGELLQTLEGHSQSVRSVAFSPDGKQLASSSSDTTIKLWNSTTGELQQTFKGHDLWIRAVAFSPDGKHLVSGSDDNTIKLWDLATSELQQSLEDHSRSVHAVAFSPDDKQLASSSLDSTIKLWDSATGELQRTLEGHSQGVRSVTFSPDGKLLASNSYDGTIKLWNPLTGELQQTLTGRSDWVDSVAFSPDGKQLASGYYDSTIKLWDSATGELLQTLEGHSDRIQSVVFSPDGKLLASGSYDQTAKLWDPATGELLQIFEGHSKWVESVAFSPDGKLLASSSYGETIKLWDPVTGELLQTLNDPDESAGSVAFSPDGNRLASVDIFDTKIWDPATGELLQALKGHSKWVWSRTGAGISIFLDQWLCLQEKRILWLPQSYQPFCISVNDGVLVLGHSSGRVSFIQGPRFLIESEET